MNDNGGAEKEEGCGDVSLRSPLEEGAAEVGDVPMERQDTQDNRMDQDTVQNQEPLNSTDSPEPSRVETSEDDVDWGGESNLELMEAGGGSECSSSHSSIAETVPFEGSPLPRVLNITKPQHNWFLLREIISREMGEVRNPSRFTERFYGSLHAVQRLELMYKLERHAGCVNAINFNEAGTRLISGSDDRLVAVWDWTIGKCLTTFNTGHTLNVFQCKYLPLTGDGHIVTCSRDGQVRLALQNSTGSYESSVKLAEHTRACHKLALLSSEPHTFLSAGEDAQIISIDVREKKPDKLMTVKEKSKKVSLYSIHANPLTGNEICVAGEDYYVRIYDRRYPSRNGHAEIKYAPQNLGKDLSVYVTCAVFNYNGTEVMGSYNDDDIYLFDTKHTSGSNYVHRYEGHRNCETVKGVNFFGPKSEYIVSGSDCGHIYFWDKNTEAIVQWMRADEEGVINCLEPHPKIPVLASSGLDSDIKIWIPSCENEPTLEGLPKAVKLNRRKRSYRNYTSRDSLNETLARWWRQMRYLQRQQNFREGTGPPVFIEIGALGTLVDGRETESISSSSSDSSSSSSSSSSTTNSSE